MKSIHEIAMAGLTYIIMGCIMMLSTLLIMFIAGCQGCRGDVIVPEILDGGADQKPQVDMETEHAHDMTKPVDIASSLIPPGHEGCTTSAQCAHVRTSVGVCVADRDATGKAYGNYCVEVTWIPRQSGFYNGFWMIYMGDQSHMIPGYPPPGPNDSYDCLQWDTQTGKEPALAVGQHVCVGDLNYLMVLE